MLADNYFVFVVVKKLLKIFVFSDQKYYENIQFYYDFSYSPEIFMQKIQLKMLTASALQISKYLSFVLEQFREEKNIKKILIIYNKYISVSTFSIQKEQKKNFGTLF